MPKRDVVQRTADSKQFATQSDAARTFMQAYVAELRAVPGVIVNGDTVTLASDMTSEDREKVTEITNRYFNSLRSRMEGK